MCLAMSGMFDLSNSAINTDSLLYSLYMGDSDRIMDITNSMMDFMRLIHNIGKYQIIGVEAWHGLINLSIDQCNPVLS